MSNKGLNSNEALDESTPTNSSVTLSGIRRVKDTPDGLDIEDYSTDAGNSHEAKSDVRDQRSEVRTSRPGTRESRREYFLAPVLRLRPETSTRVTPGSSQRIPPSIYTGRSSIGDSCKDSTLLGSKITRHFLRV